MCDCGHNCKNCKCNNHNGTELIVVRDIIKDYIKYGLNTVEIQSKLNSLGRYNELLYNKGKEYLEEKDKYTWCNYIKQYTEISYTKDSNDIDDCIRLIAIDIIRNSVENEYIKEMHDILFDSNSEVDKELVKSIVDDILKLWAYGYEYDEIKNILEHFDVNIGKDSIMNVACKNDVVYDVKKNEIMWIIESSLSKGLTLTDIKDKLRLSSYVTIKDFELREYIASINNA